MRRLRPSHHKPTAAPSTPPNTVRRRKSHGSASHALRFATVLSNASRNWRPVFCVADFTARRVSSCVLWSKFTIRRYQKILRLSIRAAQLRSIRRCWAATAAPASFSTTLLAPGVGSIRRQPDTFASKISTHAWASELRRVKLLLNAFHEPPLKPVTSRAGCPACRANAPADHPRRPAGAIAAHNGGAAPARWSRSGQIPPPPDLSHR